MLGHHDRRNAAAACGRRGPSRGRLEAGLAAGLGPQQRGPCLAARPERMRELLAALDAPEAARCCPMAAAAPMATQALNSGGAAGADRAAGPHPGLRSRQRAVVTEPGVTFADLLRSSCRAAGWRRPRRAPPSSPWAAPSPTTSTARTTTAPAASATTCCGSTCCCRTAGSSASRTRTTGAVPRHDRRHGPDRHHHRHLLPDAAGAEQCADRAQPADAHPRRVPRRLRRGGRGDLVGRLDRRPGRARLARPWHPRSGRAERDGCCRAGRRRRRPSRWRRRAGR